MNRERLPGAAAAALRKYTVTILKPGKTLGNSCDHSAKRAVRFYCSGGVEHHAGCQGMWARNVLDQLTFVLRGRGGAVARHSHAEVMQACLIPLAYMKGLNSNKGLREPLRMEFARFLLTRIKNDGQWQIVTKHDSRIPSGA